MKEESKIETALKHLNTCQIALLQAIIIVINNASENRKYRMVSMQDNNFIKKSTDLMDIIKN